MTLARLSRGVRFIARHRASVAELVGIALFLTGLAMLWPPGALIVGGVIIALLAQGGMK